MPIEGGNIKDLEIEEEMKNSYLTYAMSVIISRALPDVRDGLKPSQRRILVAMNDLNLGPRSKFRKCAKVAGDTSGNYHPHGEAVIYPTLVRMAQPFRTRYPLIEGQGNFGSIDGDPPAAMRYTEARLHAITTGMLTDLNMDTVDFVPNYDDTRKEPTVLPAKVPNILINGSSGIAVGMSTSIPPHNLCEVVEALIKLIEEPDCEIEEILKALPGPDFPTGGLLCGRKGIREAYTTGHGIVTVRAVALPEVHPRYKDRKNIVVTEIPFQIDKTAIVEKIAAVVKAGRIDGIRDVRDESDRDGMRLVIELKRGANEKVVLNKLYKLTQLQSSFSIIMVALVNGQPRTLNIKQLLQEVINHRVEVIKRRTQFEMDKANARLHIVEGLLIAIDDIDKVIQIIRASKTVEAAKAAIASEFALTDIQTEAIVRMRLASLVGLERIKLKDEKGQLKEKIKDCWEILNSRERVLDIIREDMYELSEKFGDQRRTKIVDDEATEFQIEDLVAEESVAVTVSHLGYIKQDPLTLYRRQRRGGKGVKAADMRSEDFIEHLFIASTHDYLLFFTDVGKVYWLKIYDIPRFGRTSRGRAIRNLIEMSDGENITSMIPVRRFDAGYLLLATRNGIVKKTKLAAYGKPKRGGIIAISLDENDRLVGAILTNGDNDIVLGSRNGMAIRFHEGACRPMGRTTRGVIGINLKDGDHLSNVILVEENATLLTACENGYGKRTEFDRYRPQRRSGKGLINIKTSKRNGKVVGMKTVREDDEIMIVTTGAKMVRTPVNSIRLVSRNTQGVKLISLAESDTISSIGLIAKTSEEEKEQENKGIS